MVELVDDSLTTSEKDGKFAGGLSIAIAKSICSGLLGDLDVVNGEERLRNHFGNDAGFAFEVAGGWVKGFDVGFERDDPGSEVCNGGFSNFDHGAEGNAIDFREDVVEGKKRGGGEAGCDGTTRLLTFDVADEYKT